MALNVILLIYLVTLAFDFTLDYLNIRALRQSPSTVPAELRGFIDRGFLSRSRRYFLENSHLAVYQSLFGSAAVLVFLFTGLLSAYNSWIDALNLSFVMRGVVFFLILFFIRFAMSIPLGLYRTFRVENRYGFNTTTLGLWAVDTLKALLISTALTAALLAAALYTVEVSPGFWWLWIWFVITLFGIVMIYISPYIIEPLFNRFTPLEDPALSNALRGLAAKADIEVTRIFKMDASRRTRHTNAYFTGLGRAKRIVLYDTLLQGLSREELLSIVAHEAGHWKKRHIFKHILVSALLTLVILYLSFRLFQGGLLTEIFNVEQETFFSKAVIMGFLVSIAGTPAKALFNYTSRRREREADLFAERLTGDNKAMANSLAKLAADNLSNLYPHPLYVFFNYSHPPVLERIRYISAG